MTGAQLEQHTCPKCQEIFCIEATPPGQFFWGVPLCPACKATVEAERPVKITFSTKVVVANPTMSRKVLLSQSDEG